MYENKGTCFDDLNTKLTIEKLHPVWYNAF